MDKKVIKDYYFKLTHKESLKGMYQISGMPLPDPTKGPYQFEECRIHPELKEELEKNYQSSTFVNCY